MKKAVFFINTLNVGGIETYLLRFIQKKNGEFDTIFIYVKNGQIGLLHKEFNKIENVTILTKKTNVLNILHFAQVYLFLVKTNPSTICDFSGNFAGSIMMIGRLARITNRITFYRNSSIRHRESFIKNRIDHLLKILVKFHSTSLLFNSKAGMEFYYPHRLSQDSRYKVIYNGIDYESFNCSKSNLRIELGIPQEAFVVGHLGRLDPSKNHDTIIKTATSLYHINPKIYSVLCGKGVKRHFGSIIEDKNMSDRIKTIETHSPAIEFFNTINCFYFPSITEGNPNALIEAMVCGIPIVAANIAAIKECVPAKYHSFLIPPHDHIAAIGKILHIYSEGFTTDPEEAIRLYSGEYWFNSFYKLL